MKYISIFLVFFSLSISAKAQETINWISLEQAIALQKKAPKKILMDVYTVWCGPCRQLDKYTFHNTDVVNYVNTNYYAVKFNGEGDVSINYKGQTYTNPEYNEANKNRRNSPHELARYLQINAYPTIVFFDEQADVIAPIKGYQQPQQLEMYLKLFKNDDHKKIKTQEEFNTYYKAFKPEFKG